ncbi:retron Ec78 anti-phage system effector HNH endonuclease PtuB [Endozoicomonas sp. 4G]|uniref:retron Ec78 anti-phage system effector HNH endonuclease PtuB n=1 Tax=Endozoicomonas sp. 4G TaxID=2872754 RepID=UPI0020785AD7|nr:retron Ec78 anti-phage system effector HNH endonuclease PtuB [Endozoicomonas sp. 4G]
MKKICKSTEPQELTEFRQKHPNAQWQTFRDTGPYSRVKTAVFQDQGLLCAFCETRLPPEKSSNQRVEHFHPKSDASDPNHNWTLDWDNMIGVCMGGSKQAEDKKVRYSTPENLSCDAYKDHLVTGGQLPEDCEGYVLNPLRIINTPCLFKFDKRTCEFRANPEACAQLADIDNHYESLVKLVEETIRILNLNCSRLVDDRRAVLNAFNKEFAKARKSNNRRYKTQLADRWFRTRWPSFFTTRRILLGQAAEEWLVDSEYQG